MSVLQARQDLISLMSIGFEVMRAVHDIYWLRFTIVIKDAF